MENANLADLAIKPGKLKQKFHPSKLVYDAVIPNGTVALSPYLAWALSTWRILVPVHSL
jgi:hypothetical protein